MDVDAVFKLIGSFGIRQKIFFMLICLKEVFVAGPIMHIVFSAIKPNSFSCATANGTIYRNSCPNNDDKLCVDIQYQAESTSIITEWNLICSSAYNVQLAQSVYMAGLLVGAIVFGYLADVLGRVNIYLGAAVSVAIIGAVGSFSPSYLTYVGMRFMIGFCIQGTTLTGYILVVELVGTSVRGAVGTWMSIFFTVGTILMSGIAYATKDWRMAAFFSTVWGLSFILHFWCLPESPRWLVSNGYEARAKDVMTRIAKGNGRLDKLPKEWSFGKAHRDKYENSSDNVLMLFKHCKLFRYTIIQMYSWFVTGAMYYGLNLAAGSLGNVYTNSILLSLVEVPSVFIQAFLINRIGRRRLLGFFMICGGVSCFTIQFLPINREMAIVRTIFALIGKLCASGQFSVIYIYSAEIFPTSIRNGAMGLVTVAARLGGMVTPFIVLLGDYVNNLHFTVLGAMAFTAGMFSMGLPETNNKPLPNVVDNLLHPKQFDKEMSIFADIHDSKDTDKMLID